MCILALSNDPDDVNFMNVSETLCHAMTTINAFSSEIARKCLLITKNLIITGQNYLNKSIKFFITLWHQTEILVVHKKKLKTCFQSYFVNVTINICECLVKSIENEFANIIYLIYWYGQYVIEINLRLNLKYIICVHKIWHRFCPTDNTIMEISMKLYKYK